MIVIDRVYGKNEIKDEVIIKIIKTKAMQRLKKINQAGSSQYVIPGRNVSRFEHSLGVFLLLKKLNASVEERIAGLIHDISHTAFSHVIDFVFSSKEQDFHEKFYKKIVLNSNIPSILSEYGIEIDKLLDLSKFSLLEKPLPNLCADRLDYFLRDMVMCEPHSLEKIDVFLNHLVVYDDEIVINNKNIARDMSISYLKTNEKIWANPFEVALFKILGDAIKIALDKNIITLSDLFTTDNEVYEKLKNSDDEDIVEKLSWLSSKTTVTQNEEDYDFYVKPKVRYIDPKVLLNGKLLRLSKIDREYKKIVKNFLDKSSEGFYIKLQKPNM